MSGYSDEDLNWLRNTASKLELPPAQKYSHIPTLSRVGRQGDDKRAQTLIQKEVENRTQHVSLITRILFFQTEIGLATPTYDDFTNAINLIAREQLSAGVLEALLDQFLATTLKPNKRRILQIRRKITEAAKRKYIGGLIPEAFDSGSVDSVQVLSRQADDQGTQSLLELGLSKRHLRCIQIALIERADPNQCKSLWEDAVKRGDNEVIQTLIHSPNPISVESLSYALLPSVEMNNLHVLRTILEAAADTNIDEGAALSSAVQHNMQTYVIAMLLSKKPPDVSALSSSLSSALDKHEGRIENNKSLFEMLVRAGAQGDGLSALLIRAVTEDMLDLCQLLIGRGASVQYENGRAFFLAIVKKDIPMLNVLNNSPLTPEIATGLFTRLPKSGQEHLAPDHLRIMEILLEQGAQGDSVNRTLVDRVASQDMKAVTLLLQHSAAVDYSGARALKSAVNTGSLELVKLILNKKPRPKSLALAAGHIRTNGKETRLAMTRSFLTAGMKGQPVDEALFEAIKDDTETRDLELIKLLVEHGKADCDQRGGELFEILVMQVDVDSLRILAWRSTNKLFLGAAIPSAMLIEDGMRRYQILEVLINSGAEGSQVSDALIKCVDYNTGVPPTPRGTGDRLKFAQLLVGAEHVDLNHENGLALQKVIQLGDAPLLDLFLLRKGSMRTSTFDRAFEVACSLPRRDPLRERKLNSLIKNVSAQSLDQALFTEVQHLVNSKGDSTDFLESLVRTGADVDYRSGAAVKVAASGNILKALKVLLAGKPAQNVLDGAFRESCARLEQGANIDIVKSLLAAGVSMSEKSRVLLEATIKCPGNDALIDALLHSKASINESGGEPICNAVANFQNTPLLLPKLLRYRPNNQTLERAWKAASEISDAEDLYTVLRHLLGAGFTGDSVNTTLVIAVKNRDASMRLRLCKLLTDHRASVEFDNGAAIIAAIRIPDLEVLQVMLRRRPSEDLMSTCLMEAMKINERHAVMKILLKTLAPKPTIDRLLIRAVSDTRRDDNLVVLLLEHNASVAYHSFESILRAVKATDASLLGLLLPHVPAKNKPALSTEWFKLALERGNIGQTESQLSVMRLLLEEGASGEQLSLALVKAVAKGLENRHCKSFVKDLLDAKANVNYDNGLSLRTAISNGDIELLDLLLTSPCSSSTLQSAFESIFTTKGLDQSTLLNFIDSMCSSQQQPELNPTTGSDTPLILALKTYNQPSHHEVLTRLVKYGADVNQISECQISDGREEAPLLCWAISERSIPDTTVCHLIDIGAESNITTVDSKSTPLIIAAQNCRPRCIKKLLENDADVEWANEFDETALFCASENGDTETAALLVRANAPVNDGSLHVAARNMHMDTVQFLLNNNHDPNAKLTHFHGRGVLGEVCLNVKKGTSVTMIKRMMSLLKNSGGRITQRNAGKSILLLAMDNQDPIPVTRALLDGFMADYINEDFNLYLFENHCYSPIEYVSRKQNLAPSDQRDKLVKLLKYADCKRVYYALKGAQPPDFEGAPGHLEEEEERRLQRLKGIREEVEDHQRHQSFRKEDAVQEQTINQTRHESGINHAEERAKVTEKIITNQHNLEVAHGRERTDERTKSIKTIAAAQGQAERDTANTRAEVIALERASEMQYRRITHQDEMEFSEKSHIQRIEQNRTKYLQDKEAREDESRHKLQTKALEFNAERRRNTERRKQVDLDAQREEKRMRRQRSLMNFETDQIERRVNAQRDLISEQKDVLGEQRKLVEAQGAHSNGDGPSYKRPITDGDLD